MESEQPPQPAPEPESQPSQATPLNASALPDSEAAQIASPLPPPEASTPSAAEAPVAASTPIPEPTAFVAPLPVAAPVTAVAPTVPAAPTYRDRSTLLTVFGVGQIILGLFAGLMVPLAALGTFMSRLGPGGGVRTSQFLSSTAAYAFAAVGLLTLGIGSVQMRRWARALTLVFSWYWAITGALITTLLTAVMPVMMRGAMQAQQNAAGAPPQEISNGVMAVIITFMIVFMAFFLVAVPIAYIIFYSMKDVAETCRHRDPVERWTDRVPLPVLGAVVVLTLQATYLLLTGVTTPLFPLFGRYVGGIRGFACFFVVAALEAYLAAAFYRMKPVGWWIAVITAPIRLISMVLTYTKADLLEAYAKTGPSDAEIRAMSQNPMLRGHVFLWWGLISMVMFLGYVIWLKRYFKKPETAPQVEVLPATGD